MTESGGFCTNCGATWQAGQNYCGSCGTALGAADPARSQSATLGSPVTGWNSAGVPAGAVSAGTGRTGPQARVGAEPGPGSDAPYPSEAVLGAVLLTIFMPFIALIAALVLRAQQMRPARRQQLKNWAIASAAWLATGWLIVIILFAGAFSAVHTSGCKGGIDQAVPPSYQSSDGQHWVGTFACMNGGTTTKPVPANQVPGG